ncbi:uncharacterized protein HD556DRAFT_1313036 [Suillus plorans]|uniref:DUF6533 domain-containing protein n=1 Tax=Suillus plorans TaxID=116603 RepID=A0A9P7AEB2_9AGAM|nr:uncharacterized protein HD556DRAFT_1313036 [Suillus plorans]KAG1787097.1 hypothetical protein HD556DRAFT_1313036 [Suillus plorans]
MWSAQIFTLPLLIVRLPNYSYPHPFSNNMTMVSNDPTWWPSIDVHRFASYFAVAAFVVITYDWALTFGQEVELVWVRYLGILSAAYVPKAKQSVFMSMVVGVPTISLTDTQVIIITRLHAMYQQDRKILIFLIVTFLAINTFDGVATVMSTMHTSGGDVLVLDSAIWILYIVWEVLALCLAVWIAVKHFHELRLHPAGGIIGDCFTVLMKTHLLYFARAGHDSFVALSCFDLIIEFSPTFSMSQYLLEDQTLSGLFQILEVAQMFVLGPRLILGVREYNAKLVTDSDAATGMTSIAFQERLHISTGSSM